MGVPRLREVIDATKKIKTPSVTITLLPQYGNDQIATERFAQTLVYTTLGHLVESATTIWDPNPLSTIIEEDTTLVEDANMFRNPVLLKSASRWIIRLILNRGVTLSRGLTPRDVANTIREYVAENADVVYSQTNSDQWIIRITLLNIRDMAAMAVPEENKERVHIERVLTQTEMCRLQMAIVLGGVCGISDATPRQIQHHGIDSKSGGLIVKNEWVIDTQGTALEEVWALDGVDWKRTVSNDLHEIFELLGIEAVSQVLFQEIKTVLSFDGSYVNDRHIAMVVKTMCLRGFLMPMSRHGINRQDTGVLMRISFEESVEMLMNAAVFNEVDHLKGITENIIVGVTAPMGTGSVKLMIDPEYQKQMQNIVYGKPKVTQKQQRILRSMITEWNLSTLHQSDDLDHLDRPPSPPSTPLCLNATNLPPPTFELPPTSSSFVFLPPFLRDIVAPPPPSSPLVPVVDENNMDCNDVEYKSDFIFGKRQYRPSSPDLEPRPEKMRRVHFEEKKTLHEYRPSSPELSSLPVPRHTASYIPLSIAPPPVWEDTNNMKVNEPVTAKQDSEPLLGTLELTNLSSLLSNLAPYLLDKNFPSQQ